MMLWHRLQRIFLHPPETYMSPPGSAASPDAGGSAGPEEQHHVPVILSIPLEEAPSGPAQGRLQFGPRRREKATLTHTLL